MPRTLFDCTICGKQFPRHYSKGSTNKFCSRQCSGKGKRTDRRAAFELMVKRSNGDACWLWQGARYHTGYGAFRDEDGRTRHAHRFAWQLAFGEIPNGLFVLHRCDVRDCVRPDHLFVGTQTDNMADMVSKNRCTRDSQPKGSVHYLTKLSDFDVTSIRKGYQGGETQTSIAKRYGVTQAAISAIITRKNWAHVA